MTTADFRPTHVVPQDGLPAWEAPDVNRPTTPLDALLPVHLADRLGDWGRIVCANGWSAWIDARLLIAVPRDPPAAGQPLTRTADPGPLLARTEEALGSYRRATQDLATGGTDGESFRSRTHGLRVGMVVDGESMWLYDAEHERWVYCDGTRLSTYAAGEPPSAQPAANGTGPVSGGGVASGDAVSPEPTRVVEADEPSGAGGPGATQVVPAAGEGVAQVAYGEDGARRVAPVSEVGSASGRGVGSGGAVSPEATRVVGAAHASPREDSARRDAPLSGAAEPTQVVEAVPSASSRLDPASDPDPYGEEATRRIPPVTGDPDPPLRPGDA
ncbi:hypothetical protein GCM10009837_61130 [Streptomyces durmitorensis]|uniref:hypothetical protein n=1 Tax=Streptomyces durmitorensis TaxID=319947 RepID=UPI00338C98DB